MSDTPRTDEQINGKPCTRFEVIAGDSLRNASVPSEFARQLERELNEWKRWCKEKEQALDDLAKVFSQQQDRIKRLDEAGDKAILNSYLPDRLAMWTKAKEAKLSVNPIQSLGENLMKAGIGFTTEDKP